MTSQPLRRGPARGPAGRIIPGPREPSERRGVLSVQLARLLMVRRRSDLLRAAEHARYAPKSAQRCRFGLLREQIVGRLLVNHSPLSAPVALGLKTFSTVFSRAARSACRRAASARRAERAPSPDRPSAPAEAARRTRAPPERREERPIRPRGFLLAAHFPACSRSLMRVPTTCVRSLVLEANESSYDSLTQLRPAINFP